MDFLPLKALKRLLTEKVLAKMDFLPLKALKRLLTEKVLAKTLFIVKKFVFTNSFKKKAFLD